MPEIDSKHAVQAAFLLVVVIVVVITATTAASPQFEEYVQESSEWCEERNGTLTNERAFIHGGLHCQLPNGTSVHMGDVVEVEDDG